MTLLESVAVTIFAINILNFPILVLIAKRSIETTDILLKNSPIIERLDQFAGRTHLNSQLSRMLLLSMALICEPMLRKKALFDPVELRAFPRRTFYWIQIPSLIATSSFVITLLWWLTTRFS
jgi:hypothetical protein